jgi:RNA polymerase sigma-70 factor (ECF subfamily)
MDYSKFSDEELLEAIRNASGAMSGSEAFAELYKRHIGWMRGIAQSKLKCPQDIDDVLQETWAAFFKTVTGKKRIKCVKSYLGRMINNKCLNVLKKPIHLCIDDIPEMEDCKDCAETNYERKEHKAQVRRAMKYLPARQREAFELHHFEYRSYKEIAVFMNTSTKIVEMLLYFARIRLRKILEDKIF